MGQNLAERPPAKNHDRANTVSESVRWNAAALAQNQNFSKTTQSLETQCPELLSHSCRHAMINFKFERLGKSTGDHLADELLG